MTARELLIDILPKIKNPATSFFSALNAAERAIFSRLLAMDSDLIKQDLSLDYAANTGTKALPADFYGLVDSPWIAGKNQTLTPIIERDRAEASNLIAGTPKKYEVRGLNMLLLPATATATTLSGTYYAKTPDISTLAASLPYSGLFDQIFKDATLMILQSGLSVATIMPEIAALIDEQLTTYLPKRNSRRPRRVRGNYF